MNLEQIKKLNPPASPGSYQFYNAKGEIIYIGKAANLKSRVLSYWQKSTELAPAKILMIKQVAKIKWLETDSEIEALLLEANLIKKYQPYFNVLLRDDKRFVYIKVSSADEIPGVFLTRKIDKSGRYFGPFTSSLAARETVRVIRKIFPYCTSRKIQARPCFYYQLGRCLGICGGKITREEYLKQVIKPLILFLEGKKNKIVKKLENRIKILERKPGIRNKELGIYNDNELASLKFQLKNLKHVLAGARVLSVGEKYANDTVELAKQLELPRIPERIEGYDIANIFGRQAVGAMVVFSGGEPDKSQYRKFKIKIGPAESKAMAGKQGDVQMLSQVLERRFKRLGNNAAGKENWPLPDLLIIDGGKAQLNATLAVLKKNKIEIATIAIAKGLGLRSSQAPDKLFFPGQAKPLELPLASPALHLVKRVRDEAHRFAISFHRRIRDKVGRRIGR